MEIIDTGIGSAFANMNFDACLLRELGHTKRALLHLYEWEKPTASHGYFVDPYKFLRSDFSYELIRRPTGGGVIFHFTDLTFSVLLPSSHPKFSTNTLENYSFINQQIIKAIQQFQPELRPTLLSSVPAPLGAEGHFCMAQPTRFDVMIGKRKVSGGALRRNRDGYLHQGSICLTLVSKKELDTFFKPGLQLAQSMSDNSFPLLEAVTAYAEKKSFLKTCLAQTFKEI